jgi:hypothetical protein
MLTDENDVVLDIFAGSNTTGFTAEALNRKWLAFELNQEYLATSVLRFLQGHSVDTARNILGKLQDRQADYPLKAVRCTLEPAKAGKSNRVFTGQLSLFSSGTD